MDDGRIRFAAADLDFILEFHCFARIFTFYFDFVGLYVMSKSSSNEELFLINAKSLNKQNKRKGKQYSLSTHV